MYISHPLSVTPWPSFEACRGQTLAQRWPVGHAGGASLWQLDATWQRQRQRLLLSGDIWFIYGLYMVYIWSIYGFIYGYICLYMVYMVYPDIPVGRDDVEKFDTFLNREHVFAMFIHCRSTVYLV